MVRYNFCPKCGKSVIHKSDVIKCNSCGYVVYLHSSATGSVFVVKDGKVMMAKRKDEPQKGAWDVPGGFLKYGEHPRSGARRELFEETGLKVALVKLLGIYIDSYDFQDETIRTLNFIYVGRIKSGDPVAHDDVEALKWFDIKRPIPNTAFPLIEKGLKDLRKWYQKNQSG